MIKEIKKYQDSTTLLVAKLPFKRLIRETVHKYNQDLNTSTAAVALLHGVSEAYITDLCIASIPNMIHGNRETFMVKDLRLTLTHRNDGITVKAVQEAVEEDREMMARLNALKNQ